MNKKFILLIEDNPDDEMLILQVLAQGKVINQTMVVRDGQEALDYLFYEGTFANRAVSDPLIILLDLKFQRVLQKIRATESIRPIPAIILTSSQQEKEIAINDGDCANYYLVKPVDIKKITEVIQHLLFYWARLNKGRE